MSTQMSTSSCAGDLGVHPCGAALGQHVRKYLK
jgi:hypothetical protein